MGVKRKWRKDKLDLSFSKQETHVICSIPIGVPFSIDELIWVQNKDGKWTYRGMSGKRQKEPSTNSEKHHQSSPFSEDIYVSSLTWQPPRAGFVKCNCDVSYDSVTGEASAAVIICNEQILEGDTRLFKACSANAAEAAAIRLGVFLAVRSNFSSVIFESDCANVIQHFSSKSLSS
ncbi:hypothetical protein GQ457_02G023060 [Hibiscus cannabinus]